MIITETHPQSYNFVVFDCKTKKTVSYIKSFDTETKDAIVYHTEDIGNGVFRSVIIDNKPVFNAIKLPDCILINVETQEIVK